MRLFRLCILLIFLLNFTFASKIKLTPKELEFIQQNPIITVGAEKNWPPFDFVENEQYKGVAKEYLNLIEKNSGLKFNYIVAEWDELLNKIEKKEIKLLPLLSKSKQREKFLHYTKSYLYIRDYLFSIRSKTFKDINDLANKTIAIPKGYIHIEFFKKHHPEIKILEVDNLISAIDSVIIKGADAFISNPAIVNYISKKYSLEGTIEASFPLDYKENAMHMAVNKDSEILRDIIQKSLDNISFKEKNNISEKWIKSAHLKSALRLTNEEKAYIKGKKQLLIANEFDWIPFDYYEDQKAKGYVIDYMKIISNKLGLEPVFITDKWNNLQDRFYNKELDILPVLSYSKQRNEKLNFTQAFMNQIMSIVTKKSRLDIVSLDDLNGKSVGLMKGWNTTRLITNNYSEINVIEFDSLKDIFNAVKNNFVDATIQNDLIANYYINKAYDKDLKINAYANIKGFRNELYMGVRKDLDILTNLIRKAIDSMSPKELKALDEKWINISKNINFTDQEKEFIKNNTIYTSITKKWAPFSFVEEKTAYGISIDIWNYVVDKANLKTKAEYLDTRSEAFDHIKNKKSDVLLATSKTEDKKEYALFSDSYFNTPIGIATLHDKNFIPDASFLKNKKVGIPRNSAVYKILSQNYPSIEFTFIDDILEGLELLSQDRIYALVDSMPVLSYNIKKHGFTNIKLTGKTGIDFKLQFMIREDYNILQSIINKVLEKMSPNEKEDIYNKWLNLNYEQSFNYSLFWKIILVFVLIIVIILYRNKRLIEYQDTLKRTQKELENSLANFKKLIEQNIAGILILKDGRIVYANEESASILGFFDHENLINKEIKKFILAKEDINELIENFDFTHELSAKRKDKSVIPILLKTSKIIYQEEKCHLISIVDLTEIKNKEELIIQQSKMASLGEMIGNIAHQWRQPLSFISTAASGMKMQKEFGQLTDKIFQENLDNITKTTMFLSQTIDDFQNYIKGDKQKESFNINNSIKKVLTIMKGALVNNFIKIEQNCQDIEIVGYENELNQVLLNILNNSKDALKDIEQDKNRTIVINTYKENENAIIEILDNGNGIKNEIINRVFEPYFTTKHKSQGTGLGLYMTHNIVTKSMLGEITIKNTSSKEFKKCTKVTIILPTNIKENKQE